MEICPDHLNVGKSAEMGLTTEPENAMMEILSLGMDVMSGAELSMDMNVMEVVQLFMIHVQNGVEMEGI